MPEKYNGYSNYATWNVVLWIENTEEYYHMFHKKKLSSARSLKYKICHMSNGYGFGDLTHYELFKVNWQEAYDMIYAD